MDIGIVRTPVKGDDGKSAYELAVDAGFNGTLEQWLVSLKGAKGDIGPQGEQGPRGLEGDNGLTSYQLAVNNGFTGTEAQWYERFKPETITNNILLNTQTFTSIWDTSKTSSGSTDNKKIRLPLISSGTYDFLVNWGDGTESRITAWNDAIHTYNETKRYLITIRGEINGWSFNNNGDRLKLIEILDWGSLNLVNSANYFHGCANLKNIDAINTPNTFNTTNFNNFFNGCVSLSTVKTLSYLFTSNVTSMSGTFQNSTLNVDISNFNFESVTNMTNFLTGNSTFSTDNYDKLLLSLANQNLKSNVVLDAPLTKYSSLANEARSFIINNFNWSINDNGTV